MMETSNAIQQPLQAIQHPFVYDAVGGFRVMVKSPRQEHGYRSFARMEANALYRHITEGLSPTGSEDGDKLFYAAHLVHHGLPECYDMPRAIQLLADAFEIHNDQYKLEVPRAVARTQIKLQEKLEQLAAAARAFGMHCAKQNELRIAKEALHLHRYQYQEGLDREKQLESALQLLRDRMKQHHYEEKALVDHVLEVETSAEVYRRIYEAAPFIDELSMYKMEEIQQSLLVTGVCELEKKVEVEVQDHLVVKSEKTEETTKTIVVKKEEEVDGAVANPPLGMLTGLPMMLLQVTDMNTRETRETRAKHSFSCRRKGRAGQVPR
jgi:hypothetical protein